MTHRLALAFALILILALLGLPQAVLAGGEIRSQQPSVFGHFDNPWSHWPPRHGDGPGVMRTPGVTTPEGFVPVYPGPRAVWVPAYWAWNGFEWVLVPGHWEPVARRW